MVNTVQKIPSLEEIKAALLDVRNFVGVGARAFVFRIPEHPAYLVKMNHRGDFDKMTSAFEEVMRSPWIHRQSNHEKTAPSPFLRLTTPEDYPFLLEEKDPLLLKGYTALVHSHIHEDKEFSWPLRPEQMAPRLGMPCYFFNKDLFLVHALPGKNTYLFRRPKTVFRETALYDYLETMLKEGIGPQYINDEYSEFFAQIMDFFWQGGITGPNVENVKNPGTTQTVFGPVTVDRSRISTPFGSMPNPFTAFEELAANIFERHLMKCADVPLSGYTALLEDLRYANSVGLYFDRGYNILLSDDGSRFYLFDFISEQEVRQARSQPRCHSIRTLLYDLIGGTAVEYHNFCQATGRDNSRGAHAASLIVDKFLTACELAELAPPTNDRVSVGSLMDLVRQASGVEAHSAKDRYWLNTLRQSGKPGRTNLTFQP